VKYLPQMADEDRRRYLFVAIDRATRWVFVRIYAAKTAANARRFLRDLYRAAPMRITRVLTDNVLRQEHWHAEGQQISLR
jgi:transposase-like protein